MDEKRKAPGFSNLATILNNPNDSKRTVWWRIGFYLLAVSPKQTNFVFSLCNPDSEDAVIIDENSLPPKIEVEEFKNLVKSLHNS